MENYTENIELINSYLNKTLSKKEIQDFEDRLKTNSEFNTLFNEHKIFLEGLKRKQLKTEIVKAKQSYLKSKWFKYLGGTSALVVVLLSIVYFNNFNSDKEYLKSKMNFESGYIQNFKVATDSIVEIVGEKGTVIRFNPNDLETTTNKTFIGDSLSVELIELINKQDLLFVNAQTVSNKEWLVSGGAFKIEIKVNGEPLALKKDKIINATFPKNTYERNMELFYGGRNERGLMNWNHTGDSLRLNPYVISIEQGYIIDDEFTKKYGVDGIKEVYVCDTLGFMRIKDVNDRFPKLNFYNYDIDTLRILKEHVKIIDDKYDCDWSWIDNRKTFKTKILDSLYRKKEVIIDSMLIDLDVNIASECREIWGEVSKQIYKPEQDTLKDIFSRAEYEEHRLKYYMDIEEIKRLNNISDNLYRSIELSKLGWINIDKFANEEVKVNIKLDFNINTNHNEIYLVDKNNNTVLNVYNDEIDLPINRSFYIIAIGIKGKDIYGFKKSVRFNKEGSLKINFRKINESQIKSVLTLD